MQASSFNKGGDILKDEKQRYDSFRPGESLEKLVEAEARRLSEQDLKDIALRFNEAYVSLIADNRPDGFVNWLLVQAPIVLLPPSNRGSAGAGTDGYVYINPAFWSAIVSWHIQNCGGDADAGQERALPDLKALVAHEMGHLLLRHPWSGQRIVDETAASTKFGRTRLQYIANICMDFVVNAGFCAHLFPDAEVLRRHGIWDRQSFKNFLASALSVRKLPGEIENLFQEPDLEQWGWDDLFHAIVRHLPATAAMDEMDEPEKASEAVPSGDENTGMGSPIGQWDCPAAARDLPMDTGSGDNAVRDAHGGYLPGGGTVVRQGGMCTGKENSDPPDLWKRLAAEAVAEARAAGGSAGNTARLFEAEFEVRVPWETLIRERLASSLGYSTVRQTWTRPSRKHPGLPGSVRAGGGDLWLLADVSGSITDDELQLVAGVAYSYLKRTGGVMRLVPWDTEVHSEYVLRSQADLRGVRSLCGGGGTVIFPVLSYVAERARPGDSICVCTDSEITDIDAPQTLGALKNLGCRLGPVIWIHFGSRHALDAVLKAAGQYVHPVLVDARSRLVDRLLSNRSASGGAKTRI